jgi:hypothetical protein
MLPLRAAQSPNITKNKKSAAAKDKVINRDMWSGFQQEIMGEVNKLGNL